MDSLSIIVPSWNEEKNIPTLTKRIDSAMRRLNFRYEILFIDDHSTDKSREVIEKLSEKYSVKYFLKTGKKGKAFSLIEGFQYAKYPLICMIDADLQYSPRYIPAMVEKIINGADIVVANREKHVTNIVRRLASKIFHTFFAKFLHGFSVDVQSGLKVFKREVIKHITVEPSAWTFDLEFLIKARHAGYKIDYVNIVFKKRYTGESKITLLKSAIEIGLSAVGLKLFGQNIVPFSAKVEKRKGTGFHSSGKEFVHHTNLPSGDIAFSRLTFYQLLFVMVIGTVFLLGLLVNWHLTLVILLSLLTFMYFADLLFNFYLVYQSYFKEPELDVSARAIKKMAEQDWPKYTILCPLYKEWEVLPQFVKAMSSLDYPKEKLQVILLLESDDKETKDKVLKSDLPEYFSIIDVPHSLPKTKPKALNFGLASATGEYIVIYDAEDIPDPLQLKKAVLAFKTAKKNVLCIQAKLNFYNPTQNILTRLFTLEYSLWFDLVLTGLQSLEGPIPLGGTSNHFRKSDLLTLKKWDPFNVTEDADLGMRIVKRGYNTALINSYTMEEANSEVANWYKQRSRWIKGYIQTYFVHMRRPQDFFVGNEKNTFKSILNRLFHFVTFQLVVGAKVLSMLTNPIMWIMTISFFVFNAYTADFIQSLFLTPVFYMAAISMIIGNFLYMYYYMLGASKRQQWDLVPFALLTPLYWLGMSVAAIFAIWEFLFKPHYWHKTKHGLHLKQKANISIPFIKQRPTIAVARA